jgi:hypothetical protein
VTSWFKLLYGGYGSVGYGSINSDPNFFNSWTHYLAITLFHILFGNSCSYPMWTAL